MLQVVEKSIKILSVFPNVTPSHTSTHSFLGFKTVEQLTCGRYKL